MATYLDRAALAKHEGFRDRVRIAMLITAVNVAAEAPSGDQRKDDLRAALATNVLADPVAYTERFSWAAVTNPTVADGGLNSPDGDLEFVMASLWDGIAGV